MWRILHELKSSEVALLEPVEWNDVFMAAIYCSVVIVFFTVTKSY